ncbi:cytochrome d ubiquinol oxidase subunit II [bacterium]|nr:cytochrome d ubiquinol oxidase subunit II [bacterium]
MTLSFLQHYWWFIVSLLGALFVFMMFVQGGQSLAMQLAKTDEEEKYVFNSLGRKWELTFTTLVMFGGALYAAFPLFYAISFGGAYWVWMIILFTFVVQAVSYEYRTKPANLLGKKVYHIFLYINGFLGTILIGAAVATFFTGSNFAYHKITRELSWGVASDSLNLRGLEAALSFNHGALFNILFGLMLLFIVRITGALWVNNNVKNDIIRERAQKLAKVNFFILLPFLLAVLIMFVTMKGYRYNSDGIVSIVDGQYLKSLLSDGAYKLIILLIGALTFVYGVFIGAFKGERKGFWIANGGIVFVVLSIFMAAGFGNSSFYPSYADLQSSLTIENASGSFFGLKTMFYVSLAVPLVLGHIFYTWYIMRKPIAEEDVQDKHSY